MSRRRCCCVSTRYYLRKYDANSTFGVVAQVDVPSGTNPQGTGLRLAGGYVFTENHSRSDGGFSVPAARYTTDLVYEQGFPTTWNFAGNDRWSLGTNGSSISSVTAGTTALKDAIEAVDSSGTSIFAVEFGDGINDEGGRGSAMDSGGGVYVASSYLGGIRLRYYTSSGTLSTTTLVTSGGSFSCMKIASDDDVWIATSESGNGKLRKIDSAGTVNAGPVTLTSMSATAIYCDGSGGVWSFSSTGVLTHYDSSGSSLLSFSPTSPHANRIFCADTSDNTYYYRSTGQTVSSYDNTGTLRWTTASAVWHTGGIADMAIDDTDTYIYITGNRSP